MVLLSWPTIDTNVPLQSHCLSKEWVKSTRYVYSSHESLGTHSPTPPDACRNCTFHKQEGFPFSLFIFHISFVFYIRLYFSFPFLGSFASFFFIFLSFSLFIFVFLSFFAFYFVFILYYFFCCCSYNQNVVDWENVLAILPICGVHSIHIIILI